MIFKCLNPNKNYEEKFDEFDLRKKIKSKYWFFHYQGKQLLLGIESHNRLKNHNLYNLDKTYC